jgi:hypothetical protein
VPDKRYASLFCDVAVGRNTGGGPGCAGAGATHNATTPGGITFSCCADTLPCSAFPSCDVSSTYPDPSPSARCSNARCDGAGDRERCCLPRASCASGGVFSAAACAKAAGAANATVVFDLSALCSAGACNAALTADKASCCPTRALCTSAFPTSAACAAADPLGADPALLYNATSAAGAQCAGRACVAGAADWAVCCGARATCAGGFFGASPPRECPAASAPVTAAGALCAPGGRTCADPSDAAANCCSPVPLRTCLAFGASVPGACATLGGAIANPAGASCYSDGNCRVLCCASAGPALTCEAVRLSDAAFCGGASSFLATPRYGQCAAAVAGSCAEACCR